MKTERKPVTVRLVAEAHAKLQAIKEETGLSQTKVIEMLIAKYNKVQAIAETQPKLQAEINEESMLAKLQSEMQAMVKAEVAKEIAKLQAPTSYNEYEYDENYESTDEFADLAPEPEPITDKFLYGKIEEPKEEESDPFFEELLKRSGME